MTALQQQCDEAVAHARQTFDRIQQQSRQERDRPFTDRERETIRSAIDAADALRQRLTAGAADQAFSAAIDRLTSGDGRGIGGRSIGAQFLNSSAGKWLRETKNRGARWETPIAEIPDPRVFATTITSDPTTGGVAVPPQYLPGIVPIPLRPPVVADLLSAGVTTSNALVYLAESAITNAAAAVAEGTAKPESAITFTQVTDPVVKLAHWIPVSDELLDDVPAMQTYIDTRLLQGVQVVEDDQLVNGSGVAPNMLGLLNRAGLAPAVVRVDPQTNADAIAAQMSAIFTVTHIPTTGVVMHPVNFETITLSKDTQGRYLAAGPFAQPIVPRIWGVPVALTTAIAAGTALVVTSPLATVFRRGGLAIQATNSHQDFFVKNLTAIRAEERLALTVMMASGFGKVTGLN
jgi:HK97 family phage major capsid protein